MTKSVVYKEAKAWVLESLSYNPNQRPVDLYDRLVLKFPENKIPTDDHAVAKWKRDFIKDQVNKKITKMEAIFDPIQTFNDPELRDLFLDSDKEYLINFVTNLGICYFDPMGFPSEITNGVAVWVVKIKNAMASLVDCPVDLYMVALGFATLESRPYTSAQLEKAKKYLYAKPYESVDLFEKWLKLNESKDQFYPVNVFEYLDLEDMKSEKDLWWLSLPEIMGSNFANTPHVKPHIKVLLFVYSILSDFMDIDDNLINKEGDKALVEEVNDTLYSVQHYLNRIVHLLDDKGNPALSEDKARTAVMLDIYSKPINFTSLGKFSSLAFNWYYALLINCFTLALSGGKFLDGLTIRPYKLLLRWEHFFPHQQEQDERRPLDDSKPKEYNCGIVTKNIHSIL